VNRPAIVFADEPCANRDTEKSRPMLELFRAVNRDPGPTVVKVSHEPWHQEYFDRIIIIRDGMPGKMGMMGNSMDAGYRKKYILTVRPIRTSRWFQTFC
jgi:ABC-type lipoprotein export system ATPase subunit